MKASAFEYVQVSSADEAVAQLAELGDEAKVLAGGQSLVPLLNLRLANPAYLVDINRVGELDFITNGSGVRVGAVTRHRDVERSELVARANPLLAAGVKLIGHAAIRNRGTIGGSVAHADPAAELPAILVALEGEIEARSSRGTRTIAAADFFEGFLTTTLQPDELLTEVRFPSLPAGSGWSIQEFSRRSGDFGVVTVAVTLAAEWQRHDRRGPCGVRRSGRHGRQSTFGRSGARRADAIGRVVEGCRPGSGRRSRPAR